MMTLDNDLLRISWVITTCDNYTEYVDRELARYFKDITCSVHYGDKKIKISLLYEHKSYPAKNIHLQLLRYILNVWENQAENKQELTPLIVIVF